MEKEIPLRDHQIDHYHRLLNILNKFYFYIDGSEMGTGKTYVASAIAKSLKLEIIVVSPLSAKEIWREVFKKFGILKYLILSYGCLSSKKGNQPEHGLLLRTDKGDQVSFEATDIFTEIVKKGVFLIFDECQKFKNTKQLYKAVGALIRVIAESKISKIALLSGSVLDKEEHCVNMMKLLGIISGKLFYHRVKGSISMNCINDLKKFGIRINAIKTIGWLEKQTPPTVKADVEKYLYHFFLYILKPGIMSIMEKPKIEGIKDVKNGFYNIINVEHYQNAVDLLVTATNYDETTGLIKGTKGHLGDLKRSMVESQKSKMNDMARVARSYLKDGKNKVILFADYNVVIDYLCNELKEFHPLRLTGSVSESDRTKNKSLFNMPNNNYRLLIGNCLVGSLSHNLHDITGEFPRVMLIMPNYNINELHQSTGRIFRLNTIGDAVIRFFYGQSSTELGNKERNILTALAKKGKVMSEIHAEQGIVFPNEYESEYE